jgi:hypothetical protein
LWPCVPLSVPEQFQGVAFAFISASINASLTLVGPLAGLIADKKGFVALCLFFSGISSLAVAATIVWNIFVKNINQKEQEIVDKNEKKQSSASLISINNSEI